MSNTIGVRNNGAEANEKQVEMHYILQPGGQVTIIKPNHPTANLNWFKILETKLAVSRLAEKMKAM